jgi:hypothetical protein
MVAPGYCKSSLILHNYNVVRSTASVVTIISQTTMRRTDQRVVNFHRPTSQQKTLYTVENNGNSTATLNVVGNGRDCFLIVWLCVHQATS